ncbi:hypothetical protein CEP50_18510 [Actinopolyspora mortivallis]|uniref:DUF308 domain-containing protein n=1 Tax=Actinopolyspora mortivallis TaxID=33906 RepID=A0A2T0GRY1_ACTMO|nr:hypothetical protein CEP50_18510 [Actinopolyspora mortivallis]
MSFAGPSRTERILAWSCFPLVGAAVLWGAETLAGPITELAWFPFQGVFELVTSLPEPQVTLGVLAVGALAGAVVAHLFLRDQVKALVSDEEVTILHGERSRTFHRGRIETAFVDRKQLVLLGTDDRELVRVGDEVDRRRFRAAFRAHGYGWCEEGDPHEDEYRRWVEGLPDLPAGADALLRARARALEKDDRQDAEQLREQLGELGVVVREGKRKRQYWRPVRPRNTTEREHTPETGDGAEG